MATTDKSGGTLRTDYETDLAQLDRFPVMESGRQKLLLRLTEASGSICYCEGEREATLSGLCKNHVLTVLAEIALTDVSGGQFVEVSGTAAQTALAKTQQKKAADWVDLSGKMSTDLGTDSWLEIQEREIADVLLFQETSRTGKRSRLADRTGNLPHK